MSYRVLIVKYIIHNTWTVCIFFEETNDEVQKNSEHRNLNIVRKEGDNHGPDRILMINEGKTLM